MISTVGIPPRTRLAGDEDEQMLAGAEMQIMDLLMRRGADIKDAARFVVLLSEPEIREQVRIFVDLCPS